MKEKDREIRQLGRRRERRGGWRGEKGEERGSRGGGGGSERERWRDKTVGEKERGNIAHEWITDSTSKNQ